MSKMNHTPAAEIAAGDKTKKSKFFTLISFLLLLAISISGCNFSAESIQSIFATPTAIPNGSTTLITPTSILPETETTLTAVPQDVSEITTQHELTLWVPPQFDPKAETPAAIAFNNRLESFMVEYPNVNINVRIKAQSGTGGLMESLTTTSAAAPEALPTLILLNRSSLETASLKGLILPLDEHSNVIDDSDWYDYARELAIIQGTVYGIPFVGDAALLVYRPSVFSTTPVDWETIDSQQQAIIFPADDPEALFTITLYRSLGGAIQDTQLHPTMDPELLENVFHLYENGARSGVFPTWITQYQTDSQAWQSYLDLNGNAVITWSSRYLSELPADSSAVPIPTLDTEPYTIADGWMWALADLDPERQVLGTALAEYLVDGNFLAELAPTTNYLPTRPTSLNAITNQSLKTLISQLVVAAHVRPASDLTTTIGPVVQESTVQIIRRQTNSVDAAANVTDKLQPAEE